MGSAPSVDYAAFHVQGSLVWTQRYNGRYGAMTTAMMYDTLKLAEQLEHEAGFDAARARAMARILAENTDGHLVSREDLLVTKGELEVSIQVVRTELGAKIGRLDGRIRVLYWMNCTVLAGVATLLGIAISVALHAVHLE